MIPDSHQNNVRTFEGVRDTDSPDMAIGDGDFRDAAGILNGYGARPGIAILDKGNTLVEFELPAGDNTVVGTHEDRLTRSVIYLVHNSNNDHRILRYYPDLIDESNPLGVIRQIASGSSLSFTGNVITQIRLVDNQFLIWNDARSSGLSISGTPPYLLDIQKSDQNNKLFEYEIYHTDSNFAGSYTLTVYDGEGVLQYTSTFSVTGSTFLERLEDLRDRIGGPASVPWMTVEVCNDCKIEIDMIQEEAYITLVSTDSDVILVPINHYLSIEEVHLDLIKHPPIYEPIVSYQTDTSFGYNFVNSSMFQFRVRYHYRSGEKSAWGPISIIPLALGPSGEVLEGPNYIKVQLNDDRLNTVEFLSAVGKVEIAFREGNIGFFKSAAVLDVCELNFKVNSYNFYNDKLYSTVASDESGSATDTQALKLFDNVPQIAGGLELVSDEDGNTRLAIGAGLENYDAHVCSKIGFSLEYPDENPDCPTITISGRIDITREAYQESGGPYDAQSWRWGNVSDPATEGKVVLDGFVVYLAGTTFYGISDNFLVNPTGEFTIENVPPGKYILRVAGYRCRFDDSAGEKYNINRGLEWQRTSSPMVDCAGSVAATGVAYERELDLSSESGTFDLLTEAGYGPIEIRDFRTTEGFTAFIEGYLVDNEGTSGAAALESHIGVELQNVYFEWTIGAGPTPQTVVTDCNGYFYDFYRDGVTTINLITIENFSFAAFDAVGSEVGDEKVYTSIGLFYKQYDDGRDIFYAIENSETSTAATISQLFYPIAIQNQSGEFYENNTSYIQGTITNAAGSPIENAVAVIGRGRFVLTEGDGTYSLPVHTPWEASEGNTRSDNLIFCYPADECGEYPIVPNPIAISMGLFGSTNDYDFRNFLEGQDAVVTLLTGIIVSTERFLKRGGFYQGAIVYEDRANRKSTVVAVTDLDIPFPTEDGYFGPWFVRWSISHTPPLWATHYRIVRTRDSVYSRFLQWIVSDVQYVTITDVSDTTPAASTASTASHILFKINPEFLEPADGNPFTWFYQSDDIIGFNPQSGDRIRAVLNPDFSVIADFYDYKIVGTYLDGSDFYAVVENEYPGVEILANSLMEFYTPKRSDEVLFYEQGDTYPILNPHTANRLHGGDLQDQTTVLPAEGYLKGGDTYWRLRNFVVGATVSGALKTENSNYSDSYESEDEDIGRPNVYDPDFMQIFYYNRIRVSDLYRPNSAINGLGAFQSLEYQDVNRDFGPIQFLQMIGQVMVAVCNFKIQPIYVSKDQIVDLTGSTFVGRTDRLLNIANETVSDLGCQHPESISFERGSLYAIDVLKGIPWQFSQAGQQPINTKNVELFVNLCKSVRTGNSVKLLGHYYRLRNEWMLSAQIDGVNTTHVYQVDKGGWGPRKLFYPEQFGQTGNILVSFSSGGLWVHDTNEERCKYYDALTTPYIDIVFNPDPTVSKIFHNLSILSRYIWYVSSMTTEADNMYTLGQSSRILASLFSSYQGRFDANILRDMNDPTFSSQDDALRSGRVMRGIALRLRLQPSSTTADHELRSISLEYNVSMDAKP